MWRLCVALLAYCASPATVASDDLRQSSAQQVTRHEPAALNRLGEHLFRSPQLSADSTVSCSTCHVRSLGFSGDRPHATGIAGDGRRRAPALLGLRDATSFMWDGRAESLSAQVVMPLEGAEMAVHWPTALARLGTDVDILNLLTEIKVAALDRDTVIAALVAYISSLEAGPSRFDRFFYGGDRSALTAQEAWGLRLFVRKAGCASCHLLDGTAAPFTDGQFHVTGVSQVASPLDRGRADVTGNPADAGAFKTPGLRGVTLRPFLMHDGSMTSLKEVVEHYNRVDHSAFSNLDERLKPLFLASGEVEAIVAFLETLTPEDVPAMGNIGRVP